MTRDLLAFINSKNERLRCPQCGNRMIAGDYGQREIWACIVCGHEQDRSKEVGDLQLRR